MNNFLFETGTRFLFGGGCVKEYLASFLPDYGPNVLLMTDREKGSSDALDEVRSILEEKEKIYTQIKIDEITNLGAVKIRLRSLFAALEQENERRS